MGGNRASRAVHESPPDPLMAPAHKAIARGLMPAAPPDQVIVNEYEPGQGIVAHIDCVPCFEDFIMTLSLGSACVMDLIHKETRETKPLHFASRAAVVFSGPSRYEWLHGIRQRKSDDGVARARRVSLTYRRVKLAR
jgi:alkylated DNA repair dioxygenase AlkB